MIDPSEYLRWPAVPDLKEQLQRSGIKNLILMMQAGWAFYFLAVHLFIFKLNKITVPILGLPLGYYMVVQGSLVVFVVLLFRLAKRPD